jgi:hypothetical protein
MAVKQTDLAKNIHLTFQGHQKVTQNWDFGKKLNHLATLFRTQKKSKRKKV